MVRVARHITVDQVNELRNELVVETRERNANLIVNREKVLEYAFTYLVPCIPHIHKRFAIIRQAAKDATKVLK